jgi:isoleucyl-tRNA synthetase
VRTELTPELQREGMARELVHRIQNLRKDAGFEIADRITTWYQGGALVQEAMERFADYVKAETLSLELVRGEPPADAKVERAKLDGQEVVMGVRRG